MDDVEYFELARLIRDHLLDLGLDDIADFNNYMENEGDDRSPMNGKTLIKLMLGALDRYLAANSSETVDEALQILASNIDEGEPPTRAAVHVGDDRMAAIQGREEPVEVVGLQNMVEVRTALRRLEQLLLEDFEPSGPNGGMT